MQIRAAKGGDDDDDGEGDDGGDAGDKVYNNFEIRNSTRL